MHWYCSIAIHSTLYSSVIKITLIIQIALNEVLGYSDMQSTNQKIFRSDTETNIYFYIKIKTMCITHDTADLLAAGMHLNPVLRRRTLWWTHGYCPVSDLLHPTLPVWQRTCCEPRAWQRTCSAPRAWQCTCCGLRLAATRAHTSSGLLHALGCKHVVMRYHGVACHHAVLLAL